MRQSSLARHKREETLIVSTHELDTTYIAMVTGFVYLTAVVDVASRKVLAHKVAITLEACHAKEVIEQAFAPITQFSL